MKIKWPWFVAGGAVLLIIAGVIIYFTVIAGSGCGCSKKAAVNTTTAVYQQV